MGTAQTRTKLRGLLLPHPELALWEEESGEYDSGGTRLAAVPQRGPRPAVPVPLTRTPFTLTARGPATTGTALDVRTVSPGHADGDGGATFRWRIHEDTDWVGWDAPITVSGWEPVSWQSTAANSRSFPHAVTLDDGTVVAVSQVGTTATSVGVYDYVRDPTTGEWTAHEVYPAGASAQNAHPTLLLLPSGRLQLYFWVNDSTRQTANVRMYYTDDIGGAWTMGSTGVLPEDIPTDGSSSAFDLGRLRVAYFNDQVLLVAQLRSEDTGLENQDLLVQFASDSAGAVFREVCRFDGSLTGADEQGGSYQDIVILGGVAYVFWLNMVSREVSFAKLGSASTSIVSQEWHAVDVTGPWADWNVGGSYFDAGDLAAWSDEAGVLYITGRYVQSDHEWVVYRSEDRGLTWVALSAAEAGLGDGYWHIADADTYPTQVCATFHRGRVVLLHTHESLAGTYDGSLSASYLGGSTTMTMPTRTARRWDVGQACWHTTWFPYALPAATGWTASGAGTEDLSTGVLAITCASGQHRYYELEPGSEVDEGILVEAVFTAGVGTAYVRVRLDDGVEGYEVEIKVGGTTLAAEDVSTTVAFGSTTVTLGDEVHVRIALVNNDCHVWYRLWDASELRAWTLLGSNGTLTDTGGAAGTNRVRWGAPTAGLAGAQITFRQTLVSSGVEAGGIPAAGGFDNPDDLLGRRYATSQVWLWDDVRITGWNGPTQLADEFEIGVDYTHPVSRLLPSASPSPAERWRSPDVEDLDPSTAWIHLAWSMGEEDVYVGSEVLGLYLDGLNAGAVRIDLYYDGAWHQVTSTGVEQFTGARAGQVVRPGASSTFGGKWMQSEGVGFGLGFYSGGYTVQEYVTTVEANGPGITNTSAGTSLKAWFRLADDASSESSTPSVAIWPSRYLVLIHASGFDREVRGLRLRIPVSVGGYPGVPAAGYYELGLVAFGAVTVLGHDNEGRTLTWEANVEVTTAADGTRSRRVLGRPRRQVSLDWTEPVDLSQIRQGTTPDYLQVSANAAAEAGPWDHDVPLTLPYLLAAENGSMGHALYIPSFDPDTSATSSGDTYVAWRDWCNGVIWCTLPDRIDLEQVMGEEGYSDVYRIPPLTLEEEL